MAPERTIECSAKGKFKLNIALFVMPIISIVGIVFLVMGVPMLIQRGTYNPAVDFEQVSGGCTVVSSRQTGSYRFGRQNNVYYLYTYTFSTVDDPATVVEGGEVDSRHVSGQPWPAGTRRTCWQRAAGVDAAFVSGFYTCGNPSCLKIADPQAELESKTGLATLWLALGCLELAIGSAGLCAAIYFMRRIKQ